MLKKLGTTHKCDLQLGSDSCLPKLPPQTGKFRRILRSLRKVNLVSSRNKRSKQFFRSHHAIITEKKRHIHTPYWYVIHPFSVLALYFEIIMCLTWMLSFFLDTFIVAFFNTTMVDKWHELILSINAIQFLNIIFCFLTGYHIFKTKEVILRPRKIVIHYLKTYFFFDFFGMLPASYFCKLAGIYNEAILMCTSCLQFLKFVRIKTMLANFRSITELFGIGDTTHRVVCMVILTFFFIHWGACLIYIVPRIHLIIYGTLNSKSWVVLAGIEPNKNILLFHKYIECCLCSMCHFYTTGTGKYFSKAPEEQIIFSLTLITGAVYFCYVIVLVFEMVGSANASESKYEELVYHLKEYMRSKRLPTHLRSRLLLYYENRFHRHYFRETAILSTLSEHLRYELFLHSCKALVEKVVIFQGLSKSVIGTIVGNLKQEVFLTNDVILKAGDVSESMYFISTGTVAIVLPDGREISHLEDGDHFGEISMIIKSVNFKRIVSVIAVEITELFRLDKKDFRHCVSVHEDLAEKLERKAKFRLNQILKSEEESIDLQERKDVLHELRTGRILEHRRQRKLLN